jgi:hypothetical protein
MCTHVWSPRARGAMSERYKVIHIFLILKMIFFGVWSSDK